MKIEKMQLEGVVKIIPNVFFDDRGFFYESFREDLLHDAGVCYRFSQDNHSFSKKNVLRGMHFQSGQAKLINVVDGVIFDVFVDVRKDSKTFGMWQGVILDSSNRELLLIPDGYAHGFFVLSEMAHVVYKVSDIYKPNFEMSFRYDDPDVGIDWPKGEKIVSARDSNAKRLKEVVI